MSRQRKTLNGKWNYVLDPYDKGERKKFMLPVKNSEAPGKRPVDHHPDGVSTMEIPSSWNTAVTELKYYEQNIWFYKKFNKTKEMSQGRIFLHFEGSHYRTKVWLNGEEAGEHLGGFTPFEFDVTSLLKKNNVLTVMVDNSRKPDRVPPSDTDWFNYGGIYRDVYLEKRPAKHIKNHFIYLDKSGKKIRGNIVATHDGIAEIKIPELKIAEEVRISGKKHKGSFAITAPERLKRWSTSNPKRYNVTVSFANDSIKDKIGFRTIEAKNGNILFNGKPIYLKGISVHEDHKQRGRALTDKDMEDVFRHAKALGCNFLRLAHYPHSRRMAEMADEKGILLWEEIPLYWEVQWNNRKTYIDASNQLKELISRDLNRASVVLWSIANETPYEEPGRTRFISDLCRLARRLDPSRLRTAALFRSDFLNDPLRKEIDVIGINEYLGWYGTADPKRARLLKDMTDPGKPVIVSEFGAGAKAGFHGKLRFSEEYQDLVYKEQLNALKKTAAIKGMSPWILFDFRAPRYNKYQKGYNMKGLVDCDRKTRKKAFKTYAEFNPPEQKES